MKSSVVMSFLLVGLASVLPAASINISGTGVDVNGHGVDQNYRITASTDPSEHNIGAAYVANNIWGPQLAGTQWINPSGSGCDGFGVYSYTYTTQFSLAGLNAASAVLSGSLLADDEVTMFLNGRQVGATNFGTYTQATAFTIGSQYSSLFNSGVNTLSFQVQNTGGPTGLDVKLAGTAGVATPEPGTVELLLSSGLALVVVGVLRKRRHSTKA